MQEPGGAFRHRDAMIEWSPEGPADNDKTVRWVGHLSSSATAKAVAVLALAARVYDKGQGVRRPRQPRRPRRAGRGCWTTPAHLRAKRVGGGEQPLWDDEPENNDVGARFAAAAEMWRTFRDAEALKKARAAMATTEAKDPEKILEGGWANISRFALWTLASDDKTPADLRADAKKRLLAAAELMHPRVEKTDGYRCASALDDYYWASNSNLMEKLHVLMMAAALEPAQQLGPGGRARPVALDPGAQPQRLFDDHPGGQGAGPLLSHGVGPDGAAAARASWSTARTP